MSNDDMYYNRSGYRDPTAGEAIERANRDINKKKFVSKFPEYTHRVYDSTAWKKCRKGFMTSKHYICERCGGIGTIAHHKTYITPENISDTSIVFNWNNLECLCQTCHNQEHKTTEACADGISFDANGNVVHTPRLNGNLR